ncbi:CAP domain-containing protein [Brasilonema sp. UFV-L1]|uniref:CAP domain-containing protein n=1 Tax=Brasilonema sp. UFV-L1 TaxID=2234130 RepID=UPI00145DD910|nr:CAP domain-containing protein [Brasilonema sp. UFV-L1]NMG06437.1 CAP domain-containing protein [Brasilonema sp. UFV-L1]
MFRQTAFGIALSTLVLASGMSSTDVIGQTSTKKSHKSDHNQVLSMSSRRVTSPPAVTIKSTDLERSVFDQINRYRASRGLPKLSLNARVSRQARIHSQNMANGKVPFSHQGFRRRVNAIPIRYRSAAENLAFNLGYSDPAEEAVSGWLHSPGHLANLKGNYNMTGIGVATNKEGKVYLTQIFLRTGR